MTSYIDELYKNLNKLEKEKPSVVSLFSGCGGLDFTFHKAGYKHLWANDFDSFSTQSFKNNISKSMVFGSIEDLDLDIIPKADVVLGGFPCQDFSQIWKKPGLNGTRGNLYTYFVDVVKRTKPKFFIAENVKGLLSANKGIAIKTIITDFQSMETKYLVIPQLVNFANYGVPQFRERVLIIGIRMDTEFDYKIPKFTHTDCLKNLISAGRALEKIPKEASNQEHMNIKDKTRRLLEKIPAGGNFTSIPESDPLYVKGMISHVYRRIDPELPSKTLISSGGGGTWGYHYPEPRALTNRERARIQGFPDSFVFEGSFGEVRKQIGNAVPPVGTIPFCNAFTAFFEGKFRKTDLELIGQQFSMHDIKKVIKKISKSDGFNISEIFDPLLV